jgi:predicted kinase
MTQRVYEHLAQSAGDVLSAGYPVIVDATFSKRAERVLFKELAERLSAHLQIIVCEAPEGVLRARIGERQQRGDDASEAGLAVLDWQLRHREPIQADESLDVIRVSTVEADPLEAAVSSLRS